MLKSHRWSRRMLFCTHPILKVMAGVVTEQSQNDGEEWEYVSYSKRKDASCIQKIQKYIPRKILVSRPGLFKEEYRKWYWLNYRCTFKILWRQILLYTWMRTSSSRCLLCSPVCIYSNTSNMEAVTYLPIDYMTDKSKQRSPKRLVLQNENIIYWISVKVDRKIQKQWPYVFYRFFFFFFWYP